MHKTSDLKFVFFGTPDVASETLEILKSHGYVPSLIVTSPDRPVGRHFTMTPSPTKVWADENNIPTLQPEKITAEIIEELQSHHPNPLPKGKRESGLPSLWEGLGMGFDLFIVVAYGKILPQQLIDIPPLGTLNIHYSLLPRWRGASPVEAAILAGDSETGVSIQKMVFKLDAGPVIAEARIPIEPDDTTPTLRGKLIPLGANLLASILEQLQSHHPNPLPKGKRESGLPSLWEGLGMGFVGVKQNESEMTHCGKTKKEDGLVDPEHDDPEITYRKYRAYQPWPGLHFFKPLPNPLLQGEGAAPKRIKITKARFENNKFIIEKVIREGEKESDYFG